MNIVYPVHRLANICTFMNNAQDNWLPYSKHVHIHI